MIAYLMGAALIVVSLASPASATDTPQLSPLNCKVGEAPVWISDDRYTCATVPIDREIHGPSINSPFSGNLTLYDSKCPDGWHLVLTQGFAPMCAWVLREPTN